MHEYNIFYTDDDIDDQELFLDAVHEVSENLQVLVQRNGNELLQLLKNPPPHPRLLLLDLNLPIKNGYEILKEIKQLELSRNLPVIIFTTSNDETSIDTSRKLGATFFITKPSSFAHLKNIIRHILSTDWNNFSSTNEDFVYRSN